MRDASSLTQKPLCAVFFDLDGTLVDSAPDIAVATNRLMSAYGLTPHPLQAVRAMIGNGMAALVERAFAAHGVMLSLRDFRERHEKMIDFYADTLTCLTTLMPGAAEALVSVRQAGLRTGVVTNKPEGFSQVILSRFNLLAELDFVIGGDSGYPRKPAPDMLLAACERSECMPMEALMVGDGPVDAASARAAGMAYVIVRGGYCGVDPGTLGVDSVLDSLEQLRPLLAAGEVA